jgi:hypothetical protein
MGGAADEDSSAIAEPSEKAKLIIKISQVEIA